MSRSVYKLLVLFVFATAVSCSTGQEHSNEPELTVNLLTNGSFESDGEPSMQDWVTEGWRVSIVDNPAPDGGRYSLRLYLAGHDPSGSVYRNVSAECQPGDFRLSAFGKSLGPYGGGIASIIVAPTHFFRERTLIDIRFDDSLWSQLSETFTIAPELDDSVWLVLSLTYPPGPAWSEALFDEIVLEKID